MMTEVAVRELKIEEVEVQWKMKMEQVAEQKTTMEERVWL